VKEEQVDVEMKIEECEVPIKEEAPVRKRGRPKKSLAAELACSSFSILEDLENTIPKRSRSLATERGKKDKDPLYEFGKIISSGMIGVVYLGRDKSNAFSRYVCIKKMYGEKMAEKNIYPSLKREIDILYKIRNIEGCVKFLDILTDDKSLSIVFPYYHHGDLYKYSSPNQKPA